MYFAPRCFQVGASDLELMGGPLRGLTASGVFTVWHMTESAALGEDANCTFAASMGRSVNEIWSYTHVNLLRCQGLVGVPMRYVPPGSTRRLLVPPRTPTDSLRMLFLGEIARDRHQPNHADPSSSTHPCHASQALGRRPRRVATASQGCNRTWEKGSAYEQDASDRDLNRGCNPMPTWLSSES